MKALAESHESISETKESESFVGKDRNYFLQLA